MPTYTFTYTLEELPQVAERVLALTKEAAPLVSHPNIFALLGEMGSGKTTFVRAVATLLGASVPVHSPTFTIFNVYPLPNDGLLYHFDCYRIENINDAYEIGIPEYLNSVNDCFIEWPENIAYLLPEKIFRLWFEFQDENTRCLKLIY